MATPKKSTLKTWRQDNIGRRLNEAIRVFENRVITLLHDKGYHAFSVAHINLTRYLDEEGTRLTELAQRAAITKQSMSELVTQLEQQGIVEKKTDPKDGRARIIMFTQQGLEWLAAFGQAIEQAEKEMRRELGAQNVSLICDTLKTYSDRHQDDLTGKPRVLASKRIARAR